MDTVKDLTRQHRTRRAWVVVAAAAAVTGLGLSPTNPPASGTGSAVVPSVLAQTSGFVPSPGGEAPCPEGQSRSATVYSQGFEADLPESRFNTGFTRTRGATLGSYSASSALAGTAGTSHHMFLPYRQVPEGASTRLAFTARGASRPAARVAVNSVLATFTTTTAWRGYIVDVTAATDDEDGWLGTYVEHRATSGASTSLQIDQAELYRCRPNATTRIAAADRYATAARLSQSTSPGVATVYVAQGGVFADALSASARAGSEGSPILLVRSDSIPTVTAQALDRLNPQRIVVLGGTRTIEPAVETALASYAPRVERIGGTDRYMTSALVSQSFAAGVDRVYVATGTQFADALSGAALAAHQDSPLLLVGPGGIPDPVAEELERLRPGQVVVLGGPAAVSEETFDALAPYAVGSGAPVRRISGANRYDVSALVAAEFGSPQASYLATGTDFADAVTGGAVAGARGAPLLLSRPADLPASVRDRLGRLPDTQGTVVGGTDSITPIVRDRYGRTLP